MSKFDRAKSFRFFGANLKDSSARDSVAEIDEDERTSSMTKQIHRKAEKQQAKQHECEEELRHLYLIVPKSLDVQKMRDAIAAGKAAGVDSGFLDRCTVNLHEAEKIAEKKKEAERLAKMMVRKEEATAQLEKLLNYEKLTVDIPALSAALQAASELEEEPGPDTHHVDASLLERSRQFLTDAETAHAERRKEALAQLKKSSSCVLTVDAESLRAACDFAKEAGVDKQALSDGHNLLAIAEKRTRQAHKLQALASAETPPGAVKIDALREAFVAGLQAAAPGSVLKQAHDALRGAEEAQAERSRTSAYLTGLLEVPAQSLDVDAVREAKALAEEASALPALLLKADTALAAAAQAQLLRDAATASLLVLAAPRAPEKADMNALRDLLPKAGGAGVSEDVVSMSKASLGEAEDANAAHREEKRQAHIARLDAANARTASSAPAHKARLEACVGEAEEAVSTAKAAADAKAAARATAYEAAAAALQAVLDEDAKVIALHGDEQKAEWERDEEVRKALIAADAAAREAAAAAEVAALIETEASWQLSKAKREVGVYAQIADVITAAKDAPPPTAAGDVSLFEKNLKKNLKKKGSSAGGCCGGGKSVEIVEASDAPPEPSEPPLAPLPLLIDEIAWSPLKLPTGSTHQVELLLCFALGGFYSHPPIAAAVANSVCASDPTYVSCSKFVLSLSDAFDKGVTTLRAGGNLVGKGGGGGGSGFMRTISKMASPRFSGAGSAPAGAPARNSSRRESDGGGGLERADSSLKRASSSFFKGRSSKSGGGGGGGGHDDAAVGAWPGREVQCEIGGEQFKQLVQTWLAGMARGSQAKGQGKQQPKEMTSAAKADGNAAATVGRLSSTMAQLMRPPHSDRLEKVEMSYTELLAPLLERHYEVTEGRADEGDEGDEAAIEAAASLADVHACIELILGASRKDKAQFAKLLPVWTGTAPGTAPATALAGMARAFAARLPDDASGYASRLEGSERERVADLAVERVILALAELFVARPDSLVGFQQLVSANVFDTHLVKGSRLRNELGQMLRDGGMDGALAARIETDDELVKQPFFWSAPGMKLFGNHPDLEEPSKLKQLLADALSQQAIIAAAFLDETISRAAADAAAAAKLPPLVATTLTCLLEHVRGGSGGGSSSTGGGENGNAGGGSSSMDGVRRGVFLALDTILYASATYSGALFAAVAPAALKVWSEDDTSTALLDKYVEAHLKPRLDKSGTPRTASERDQGIVQTLCSLFIASPAKLFGFLQLTPAIFDDVLSLGSEARERVNNVLMTGSFEPSLAPLIARSDDFVKSSFFWAADGAMNLCLQSTVSKDYAKMNGATRKAKDGSELHLYSRLLALLLRLSSLRGGEVGEIASRTKEVLDQFERNPDQQHFVLSIIEKLDERSIASPSDFNEIALTVLSDVAANGVQTITSVQGEGMALCEQAMTTLLQSYIAERKPSEWKELFKDATNIAFMVKYMFRESLPLAKEKFKEALGKKNANFSGEAHSVMSELVKETLFSYGDVGIYDPEQLAEIDFLNHPEELVELVGKSKNRASRAQKPDMQLLTEVTTKWMQLKVDQKFPPLTPHHTQAFTVLMMCKFFQSQIIDTPSKKQKMRYKSFIAQLATGEGKSVVIAMLAIFMVRLYNMKVHVLENNAGLLQRDFLQNRPFFEKFGLKVSHNLDDADAQIYYCLKDGINRRFLRKLVEGGLDEDLGKTVLIVDEVDDLIVNEHPNSHYVKKDAEKSPALKACYEELKSKGASAAKPSIADDETWQYANAVVDFCKKKTEDVHYRVVQTKGGGSAVMMLDADGNLPKVALTAPWLSYLNYSKCGVEPHSETRHATVCTPYIFNKYKGIFGLTGSVGGKAELKYLGQTYKALKFDVPRFLDTCTGDARKVVTNHGVEIVADEKAQIDRVCALAGKHFKDVPVLIICSSLGQLQKMYNALSLGEGKSGIPPSEVQRFAQFSTDGKNLAREWQTIIDDSTKRYGNAHESRCRVTVTDKFGGRGHDFQVIDKESNLNGGMLVIATSIPDEREWIQWKGRTARQDRPGQFYVVLSEKAKPFDDPKHKKLKEKLKKLGPSNGSNPAEENAKVELLLDVSDEGIGEKLKEFESEQARGEKLNELTERYYKRYARGFDDPWPNEQFMDTDKVLRKILTGCTGPEYKPKDLVALAKQELDIEVEP